MQLPSRIVYSWSSLASRLEGVDPTQGHFWTELRHWLRHDLPSICSELAALAPARGAVQLVLEEPPASHPVRPKSAAAFMRALADPVPKSPVLFLQHVEHLVLDLCTFRLGDDFCPTCQGELSLLQQGELAFWECSVLGCRWDISRSAPSAAGHGAVRATRTTVAACFPDVELVACPTPELA